VAYASQSGRARTNPRAPQAHAICDRCGFRVNRVDLQWQFDWAGASLINKRILVCDTCYDEPQQQLRAIVVPADPVPIENPRIEYFVDDETDYRVTSGQNSINYPTGIPVQGGNNRITQDNNNRVTQETGEPPLGLNQLPGTDPNAVTYRNVTGAVNNGSGLIRLSMATTNGIISGQSVIVQMVNGVPNANGNWIVTVVSPTQIDLQGSSFTGFYISGGYVINNPSLPYNFSQVPNTGSLT